MLQWRRGDHPSAGLARNAMFQALPFEQFHDDELSAVRARQRGNRFHPS